MDAAADEKVVVQPELLNLSMGVPEKVLQAGAVEGVGAV